MAISSCKIEALHAWLTARLDRVSGKPALAEAIRHARRHWPGPVPFLDDGRLELDTNSIERVASGRAKANGFERSPPWNRKARRLEPAVRA